MNNLIYLAILVDGNDEYAVIYELGKEHYNAYKDKKTEFRSLYDFVDSIGAENLEDVYGPSDEILGKFLSKEGREPKILWGIFT